MNTVAKTRIAIGIVLSLAVASQGETPTADIASVAAAGKVSGAVYLNSYFGISLTAPKAKWEVRGPIDVARRQARLIDAAYDSGEQGTGYTLALLVESLQNFPKGTSTEVYLRNIRHRVELDGLKTQREEFPVTISGVAFTGAILLFPQKPNFGYYRALYSTVLDGYFVTIEVQCAPSEERLQELLSSAVKINAKGKP
jgi:hypothetical protein